MMITFISQCQKKAHGRTRRVLDAFANRIGDNAWQTLITQEGLEAVKKLLRKTASKNTAVSCHWIRSRSRSDLLWIVGNRKQFDSKGNVPVNITAENHNISERFFMNTEIIALLSSLAGFFHDVGKANTLFQCKLKPNNPYKNYEPYRHEWVSLRIFQAFVHNQNDREWLEKLSNITNSAEEEMIGRLEELKDGITSIPCPAIQVLSPESPPIAKIIAWLIVSHHRLPVYPKKGANDPDMAQIDKWLYNFFGPSWNSPQCLPDNDWTEEEKKNNWCFSDGTPLLSVQWQTHVGLVAQKILRYQPILDQNKNWLTQQFTAHIARLSLMLADHYYSSDEPDESSEPEKTTPKWQDRNYPAYANSRKDKQGNKQGKQKLDEHNIAVGIYAGKIAKALPALRDELPKLPVNKMLEKSTKEPDFVWQNRAYELAKKIRKDTSEYGFFGICQASTGTGKTLANARIMYGISEPEECRFNIALGLRTLTMQTAEALRKELHVGEDALTMLVGSQAVKDLYANSQSEKADSDKQTGSESSESLLQDDIEVIGETIDYQSDFTKWIKHEPKIIKLIQAPILVSTIDYLMPASEGIRGGRQIAPMLRLLTSDLVLDEPDDFNLDDLPALCRLVNWAGMLGSRVLLSTATIPPILARALFQAYQAGRKQYTEVNGKEGLSETICCAWFDEFKQPKTQLISNTDCFKAAHKSFVSTRVTNIEKNTLPLRKAKLVDIGTEAEYAQKPSEKLAHTIKQSIHTLHQAHAINVYDKKISIGLVRMANIDPLVHVAKTLLREDAPNDTRIHYCIYHGRFPLIQRSSIERTLDKALNRNNTIEEWVSDSGIAEIVKDCTESNHIFVVIATSVAEVGRDHDYDWAIIEPSSMRSIIQLAGRVQRHRKMEPKTDNIHILAMNYKGLKNKRPCFEKPGFETNKVRAISGNLRNLGIEKDIKNINAVLRIQTPKELQTIKTKATTTDDLKGMQSFNLLEYMSQYMKLYQCNRASIWWQNHADWCGELQRRQPFRQSAPKDDYCRAQSRKGLIWCEKNPQTYPTEYKPTEDIKEKPDEVKLGKGSAFWMNIDIEQAICQLQKKIGGCEEYLIKKFTHLSLTKLSPASDEHWHWHNNLGIYKPLTNDKME